MRNLTFAALLLTGGVIAALPFRKSVPLPIPAESGAMATGPVAVLEQGAELVRVPSTESDPPGSSYNARRVASNQSALASDSWGPSSWESSSVPRPSQGSAIDQSSPGMRAAYARHPNTSRHPSVSGHPSAIESNARVRGRRDPRLPLTYEDLAVPLQRPDFEDGRYSALAEDNTSASNDSLLSEQIAPTKPMGAMFEDFAVQEAGPLQSAWSLAANEPPSILQESFTPDPMSPADHSQESQITRTASSKTVASPAPQRERHWIRQPD